MKVRCDGPAPGTISGCWGNASTIWLLLQAVLGCAAVLFQGQALPSAPFCTQEKGWRALFLFYFFICKENKLVICSEEQRVILFKAFAFKCFSSTVIFQSNKQAVLLGGVHRASVLNALSTLLNQDRNWFETVWRWQLWIRLNWPSRFYIDSDEPRHKW